MVVLSIVDVAGYMHFWGLTIDTISCVNLIIAMGLCVDYSVHIAHWFIGETGADSNERVRKTIAKIGPAVFHGGISTFLAFLLLAFSNSHVFITFFKVFLLMVAFGLYHGLVVLPIILSFVVSNVNSVTKDSSELDCKSSEDVIEANTESSSTISLEKETSD
jgi:predicted RND superfamily exporter protein